MYEKYFNAHIEKSTQQSMNKTNDNQYKNTMLTKNIMNVFINLKKLNIRTKTVLKSTNKL